MIGGGGWSHTNMVYGYVPALWGIFDKIWHYHWRVFKTPEINKSGVFEKIYCNKHTVWTKIDMLLLSYKNGRAYGCATTQKFGTREIQIF